MITHCRNGVVGLLFACCLLILLDHSDSLSFRRSRCYMKPLRRIRERFRALKRIPSYESISQLQDSETNKSPGLLAVNSVIEGEQSIDEPTQNLIMKSFSIDVGKDDNAKETLQPAPHVDIQSSHPLSVFPKNLLPLVPEQSPLVWMIINNSLAVSGLLLLFDMFYATGEVSERPFATAFSLIWEFATCLFWTLETGLSASYQHWHLGVAHWPWYTKLEMVIAAYFTVTTLAMLMQWKVMNHTIEVGEFWEIGIDTSFYVYLALRSCFRPTPKTSEEDVDNEVFSSEQPYTNLTEAPQGEMV